MKNSFVFLSEIGLLTLTAENDSIIRLDFGKKEYSDSECKKNPLITAGIEEINAYLDGRLREFSVPYRLIGTDFQIKALNAVAAIPYGETRSYGDIAKAIGLPKACRAVGSANNRNPLPIFIPCHRVVGSNGSLVGYAGGLQVKEKLLAIEKELRRFEK